MTGPSPDIRAARERLERALDDRPDETRATLTWYGLWFSRRRLRQSLTRLDQGRSRAEQVYEFQGRQIARGFRRPVRGLFWMEMRMRVALAGWWLVRNWPKVLLALILVVLFWNRAAILGAITGLYAIIRDWIGALIQTGTSP